jgi:predicted membrane protein DUF2231
VTTIQGLPAHVLLVHFVVVVAPLTAILAIVCAVVPAVRRRLVWLVVVLAVATTVATPLTTSAGEWLRDRLGSPPGVHTHAELGDSMIYFAAVLLVSAGLLAVAHVWERRARPLPALAAWVIAALVIAAGAATVVQVYRIGDSGAKAVWMDQVTAPPP